MPCSCDYDPPEFYRAERRKSRKPRQCCQCGHLIAKGETYENVVGKTDGDQWAAETCARCLALRDYVKSHVPCYCYMHHDPEFIPDAIEVVRDYAHELPGMFFGALRLAVAIKRASSFVRVTA